MMFNAYRQRRCFAQGCALLQAEQWQQAEAVFRRAVELDGDDSRAWGDLAIALLKQERWEEAVTACRAAIGLNSTTVDAHENLGIALLKLGRWDEAIEAYRRVLELDPDGPKVHDKLGIAFAKQERWAEAEDAYRQAIARAPRDADLHRYLGLALLGQERWDEAAAEFRASLTMVHGGAEASSLLAMALDRARESERLVAARQLQAGQWDEVVATYQHATARDPDNHAAHESLGVAFAKVGRWDEAIAAHRRAIELDASNPESHRNLGAAYLRLNRWQDAATALRAALSLHPDDPEASALLRSALAEVESPASDRVEPIAAKAGVTGGSERVAAYMRVAVELLRLERWQEAVSLLRDGAAMAADPARFQFLLVDPLVRLGRGPEAASAYREATGLGAYIPALPGAPARQRIERRRESFWTPANLGADVFRVERWLEQLIATSADAPASPEAGAKLLFVLDNDYGELTTLMYLLLGQDLVGRTTLLLPDRLHANNLETLPDGRTQHYGSLADIVAAVERERPEVVFLCSGYLFSIHEILTLEDLESLVGFLCERGCRVVTSDPFLGMLSKHDPRTLVDIDLPDDPKELSPELRAKLRAKKEREDERLRTHFARCEAILADSRHLYPAYCGAPDGAAATIDARNICFFNPELVYRSQAPDASASAEPGRPHWLFVLSQTDYDTQVMFEGHLGFLDIVAGMLVDAVAAGRHPVIFGPNDFIAALAERMPTTEGIDILSFCSFKQFVSLSLAAEYVFYWNVLSHSILIRLFNKLPVVVFDKGHLIRNVTAVYDRVVEWYYQGWEPPLSDQRQPLTLEGVAAGAEAFRRAADRIVDGFRQAPTPRQMIDSLVPRGSDRPES